MTKYTETFNEAVTRLESRTQTRSDTFITYVDPKSSIDMEKVQDLKNRLRQENKKSTWETNSWGNKYKIMKRVYIGWRLPKGSKGKDFEGYQGESMPHFKQKDAVVGLLYVRGVMVWDFK